jgi:hypothetical protein
VRLPIPSLALWSAFAVFGGATVLSYSALGERFPKELAGRANTALNLMHIVAACLLQWLMGFVIELWPAPANSAHPAAAYAMAFTLALVVQLAALVWLAVPAGRRQDAGAAAERTPLLADRRRRGRSWAARFRTGRMKPPGYASAPGSPVARSVA